jgi:hypothetical protein
MHVKRTLAIVLGVGAMAAWLAGAATSNRTFQNPIVPRPAPIDAQGDKLATEISRLHERLRPTAAPHAPGRNLFAFHTARPQAPPVAPKAALTESPLAGLIPPEPVMKLAGIAEDPGADGPIRQAIISTAGQLFIVKEGESVTGRYRVARIAPDVVELTDLVTNVPRRLALK